MREAEVQFRVLNDISYRRVQLQMWHSLRVWSERRRRLVGCLTARQHRKVNVCYCAGGKPAQSDKDGQRDTMHITLRYTITM